jgi:hypothetical protein
MADSVALPDDAIIVPDAPAEPLATEPAEPAEPSADSPQG